MLWGVWLVVGAIFVGIWLLYWLEDGRGHGRALEYRHKYLRLIDRLGVLVSLVNALNETTKKSSDVRVLDSFHSHLKMLETLMEAVRVMPSFSTNVATLQAPLFLVGDITDRITKLSRDLSGTGLGTKLAPNLETAPLLGCYFCSRPFDPALFKKVRVKVEGTAQDVASCSICNAKLTSGKKAKVLFFSENGDTVHWSKAKDYVPSATFWNINDSEVEQSKPESKQASHLTLVYSNVSKLSSTSKID